MNNNNQVLDKESQNSKQQSKQIDDSLKKETNDVIVMIKLNCDLDNVYNNKITDEMLDVSSGYNIYIANVGSSVKNYTINDIQVFHGKKYLNHKGRLYIENKEFIGKVDNEITRNDPKNFDQNPKFILATAKFRKLDYNKLGHFMQYNYNLYSQRGESNSIFISYRHRHWYLNEDKLITMIDNSRRPFNVLDYSKHFGIIQE